MISDVLSDAVVEIRRYLADEPNYVFAAEIRALCQVMDTMRSLLDDPAPSAEWENTLRGMLPPFDPRCGCLVPPDAGGSMGWHQEANHAEVAVGEASR